MKNKKKGILQLLLVVVIIGALTGICIFGVGQWNRGRAAQIDLGLDLAGGVSVTYEATGDKITVEKMELTKDKLRQRVQNFSLESDVYIEGDNRINVDIPGATDAKKVLDELGRPASVEFRDPDGNVLLDGSMVSKAEAVTNTNSSTGAAEYLVLLNFNSKGTKVFAEATEKFLNQKISIYYDGELVSAPTVQAVITNGEASISGQASFDEANQLATYINIGALPLELKEIRSNVVGAKLGLEALDKSLLAGAIGFILVLIFMISLYRIPGVAASIALVLYVLLMLLALNGLNITLTLPGVAGIVLSIGMAVDANVIIFTRIKEEIAKGKTVRSSIKIGFEKALSAIVDGNVTTLLAAAVLYFIGSGTVKGFATTLAIGIILSMFTALVVTKFVLNALFALGLDNEKLYGAAKEYKVRNYVGNFKKFAAGSLVVILIGFAIMGYNKVSGNDILNFGLDFKGGTSTSVVMKEECTDELKVKVSNAVENLLGETPVVSEVSGENTYVIKTNNLTSDKRAELETMFTEQFGVAQDSITSETISATVSNEMKTDAVKAVLIATVCMLLYIWIRFKDIRFGSSAVIALLHDVLIVLTVYAVVRIAVGNTFIACMLTIVGYSINATIVIFDRIRENLRGGNLNTEQLAEVVNRSISQTFTRSINTSLTTLIMVVVLYIFGVDALREFALPLIVGIVCGAYSSICITGGMWYVLKARVAKKNNKR